MSVNWAAFADIVKSNDRFLLTSHIRPDCDALGSELGMAHLLEALGKDAKIVNGQATPPNLAFLDPTNRIRTIDEDVVAAELQDRQILIVLDTSAWAQLGPMSEVVKTTGARKLIVDHHVGEDDLGAELFKDTTAEATGRLVVEAADHLGVALTPEMSTPLFAAVATDTGWYRFGSVGSHTYKLAAKMVEGGADPAKIYNDLYEQETIGRMRLRGIILSRLVSELDGRLVHTYVLQEDFEKAGAIPQDTEDAINLALSISGTEGAVILVEQLTGGFKVSFRSRCHMDCSAVARNFGGGGHKAAAGAFIEDSIESAQRNVLDRVRAAMK